MKLRSFLLVVLIGTAGQTAVAAAPDAADRREPVRRALAWLIKAEESDAWKQGTNPNMRDAVVLMTAWLLEANSDFPEFEKARLRFRDRADRLIGEDGSALGGFSADWLQGFASLYAYERSLRDGKPYPALDGLVRSFLERQNAEGGWCHGQGNPPVKIYPSTMIATTNLALFALGAAQRGKMLVANGVDYKRAVREGLKLLRDVQGHNGGMPYGGRPCRLQNEAARTAEMLLMLAALRQTDDELFRNAATYVLNNLEAIPNGHGGEPFGVAFGGLGCFLLSDDAWRLYDAKVLERVRKKQRKDGAFSNSKDVIFTAYFTAFDAIGLSADRTMVAQQLRLHTPFKLLASKETKRPPPAVRVWQFDLDNVVQLQADARTIVALQKDGTLSFVAADSGKLLGKSRLPVKEDQVRSLSVLLQDGKAFVLLTSNTSRLWCCDPTKKEPAWQTEVGGVVATWWPGSGHLDVLMRSGELVLLAPSTGQVLRRFTVVEKQPPKWPHVQALPGDRYVVANDFHLTAYDSSGQVLWEDRIRAVRGVTPPGFGALAAASDRLYTGGEDGRVEYREQETGQVVWRVQLKDCIAGMYVTGPKGERVLAVGGNGMVYGLQKGKEIWRFNASNGIEKYRQLEHKLAGAGLVIAQPGQGRIVLIDADGGRVKTWAPYAETWTVTDHHLITCSDGCLHAYRLQ